MDKLCVCPGIKCARGKFNPGVRISHCFPRFLRFCHILSFFLFSPWNSESIPSFSSFSFSLISFPHIDDILLTMRRGGVAAAGGAGGGRGSSSGVGVGDRRGSYYNTPSSAAAALDHDSYLSSAAQDKVASTMLIYFFVDSF